MRYIKIVTLLPIKSQRGYIGLAVIAFLLSFAILIYPLTFPPKPVAPANQPKEEGCIAGQAPSGPEEISGIPAIKDMFNPAESDMSGGEPIYGGPDPVEKATFVLVRKNVPTLQKSVDGNDYLAIPGSTGWPHTVNAGELPEKPGYTAYYPSRWGEIDTHNSGRKYVRNAGLLIFASNDPSTITVQGTNLVYMTDVYQDKRIYEQQKNYDIKELFVCNDKNAASGVQVTVPNQAVSPKKDQLQLEWFLFTQGATWGVHCKPAVYLYPERKQLVNVKVFPKGELVYTDPPHDKEKGWTVWAYPDGALEIRNTKYEIRNYDYLYYESKLLDSEIKKPTKGWMVKGNQIQNLLNKVLSELGLNGKEKKDFEDYWLNKLPESPYYFVGLVEKEQRDYLEPLSVTPNPDTSIRFSLYFEMLDKPKVIEEPIINTPNRNGFTLVDWGGMVKLHPNTPFTCSQ